MKKILSKIALMIVLTSGILVGAACSDKQTQFENQHANSCRLVEEKSACSR